MAYGNPGNPGPSGDYFDGGNMAGPAEEKPEGKEEGSHETGILPKSLMAGKDFKVGEEIVLKITAIHENDFEVEYAYDEGSEKGEGEEGMESTKAPSDDMASMME